MKAISFPNLFRAMALGLAFAHMAVAGTGVTVANAMPWGAMPDCGAHEHGCDACSMPAEEHLQAWQAAFLGEPARQMETRLVFASSTEMFPHTGGRIAESPAPAPGPSAPPGPLDGFMALLREGRACALTYG